MADSLTDRSVAPLGATQTFDQLAVQHDPLLGQTVGNYHLLALAGEGASGRVYRARDVRLDRIVAVKMLHTTASKDRFEQEARALARLGIHAGVVDVYTWGEHDGRCYLALEYLPESTATLLARRPEGLDASVVMRVGEQCAVALASAHRAGVIHGDLKPSNILLAADLETAKLCDFGLASLAANTPLQGGTPAFLAPECAAGAAATPASDIYALGATLYALLVGTPPVDCDCTTNAIAAAAAGKIRPLAAARPDLPAALVDTITRALATDPARRFAQADEFAEALRAAQPKRVESPRSGKRGPYRRLARLLAMFAAVLVAGLAVMLGQSLLPGGGGGSVVLADARMKLNEGNYSAARVAFEQFLNSQPDSAEARYGLAYSFLLEGDQERAAAEFSQLGEKSMQAEGNAAVAYMASGEAARPALERAAGDVPSGYASVLLAMLDMMAGNFEAAQGRLNGVEEGDLSFDWQRRQYLQALGQIYYKTGNFDQAERVFSRLEQGGGTAAGAVAADYVALSRERAGTTERQEVGNQIARLKTLMQELPPTPDADAWSSRPLRIWIPPVDAGSGLIMQETGLSDVLPWRLARGLSEKTGFPLTPVERGVQGAILAEQEFSAALGQGDNALRLGRVLGARLMLLTKVTRLFQEELLHVSIVDTETTRPVPVGEYQITRNLDPNTWLTQLQQDIVAAAENAYPIRGKITLKDDVISLNVGSDVGVEPGMHLSIHPAMASQALAGVEAVVSDHVLGTSAEVRLTGVPATSIPEEGWYVEALDDQRRNADAT